MDQILDAVPYDTLRNSEILGDEVDSPDVYNSLYSRSSLSEMHSAKQLYRLNSNVDRDEILSQELLLSATERQKPKFRREAQNFGADEEKVKF